MSPSAELGTGHTAYHDNYNCDLVKDQTLELVCMLCSCLKFKACVPMKEESRTTFSDIFGNSNCSFRNEKESGTLVINCKPSEGG